MKKKKKQHVRSEEFQVYDGSHSREDYDAGDYADFISNGMTNNEKIDAVEYFEEFLDERP